ncbi:succinyltransferase-like protein [Kribbella pratensis]|uniref:Succinyltransferase-like protein n=1 Tax=Kribbella pratensis TaxID=2512112 RepID=A0A4R8CLA9_9ACTN|nr:succinyltransferase-like protein [Kribbella pratensis]
MAIARERAGGFAGRAARGRGQHDVRAQRLDHHIGDDGRVRIGEGTFLNVAVMVAALDLVEIGSHCMLANGCFVTDANHRFDDPDRPVPWQGFDSKGPTRIGDNVWLGANVVVTSGVTIGERCVIGANSVVTQDIPSYSVAAGAPAKVLRAVTYPNAQL